MKTIKEALSVLTLPFELAPLQYADTEYLSAWTKVGLFYEVGCGKTVVSTLLAKMYDNEQNLVIVPPILIAQWEKWLKETDPEVDVQRYYGPGRALSPCKWLVTSQAIFRNDFTQILAWAGHATTTVIVDEAQALKNIKSVLYKRVKALSLTHCIIFLTGTPTSKPADAYSYISIKTPKVYRSFGHFENMHVTKKDIFGTVTEWQDLETINENLYLQSVKRTKEEVFGNVVAPPVHQIIDYELSKDHLALYQELVENLLLKLPNDQKIDATTPQKLYHAAGQIVCNLGYFCGDDTQVSAAIDLVDQIIEQTDCLNVKATKLIIYSNYIRTNDLLLQKLGKIAVGAYSKVNSQKSIASFMEDSACRILVAHYLSAGVGLNPQGVCNVTLFLEPSTVPMQIRQAAGRVDRIGQKKIPTLFYGRAKGTVQGYLLDNLLKNDDLVAVVEDKTALRKQLLGLT
jgi:SNF2 family DNA or RNA helicase